MSDFAGWPSGLLLSSNQRRSRYIYLRQMLVPLADHGFTRQTAIAARLTLYSAPDALQGAMAANVISRGSRFLGVTEEHQVDFSLVCLQPSEGPLPETDAQSGSLPLVLSLSRGLLASLFQVSVIQCMKS